MRGGDLYDLPPLVPAGAKVLGREPRRTPNSVRRVDGPDVRRSAAFVTKVLQSSKPADLPVEQPTKFELVVNRKTAKALGLKIAESFLLRADTVID
jgi:ABC transporter substrate binding protein